MKDGEIPFEIMEGYDHWIYKNKKAFKSLLKGMEQSKNGETFSMEIDFSDLDEMMHRCETKDGWTCLQLEDVLVIQFYIKGERLQNTLVNYCPFCGFSIALSDLSKNIN